MAKGDEFKTWLIIERELAMGWGISIVATIKVQYPSPNIMVCYIIYI